VRRALVSKVALPVLVVFVALVVTGPLALVLVPALIAAPAAAVAEQLRTMPALRRSWQLTRTRRVRSFVFAFTVLIGSLMLAPLVGVLVMLVIGGSFTFVNLIAAVVNAFTMPWLGAAIYLHFTDLAMATAAEDDGVSEVDG
jgi:membrane-anchored glycerophosphoryl diester phosphodiesterase (GDPDase)